MPGIHLETSHLLLHSLCIRLVQWSSSDGFLTKHMWITIAINIFILCMLASGLWAYEDFGFEVFCCFVMVDFLQCLLVSDGISSNVPLSKNRLKSLYGKLFTLFLNLGLIFGMASDDELLLCLVLSILFGLHKEVNWIPKLLCVRHPHYACV